MTGSIDDRKDTIRTRIRDSRASISEEESLSEAEGLLEQLQTLVIGRGARSVTCYYPVVSEPNTLLFLEWARQEGLEILLPVSREDGLLDWVSYAGPEAEPGLFGIPEPAGELLSPLAASEVDLMLVPASAVDEQGNRLGWGRGYFDKSLGSMDQRPPVFAIIRDSEVFDEIPTDVHDVPLTGAVTPERILYFQTEE